MGDGLEEKLERGYNGAPIGRGISNSVDAGTIFDGAEVLINSLWAALTYHPLIRSGSVRLYAEALGRRLRTNRSNGKNSRGYYKAKVPSPADMAAYPTFVRSKENRTSLTPLLESRFDRIYALTGDRYRMLMTREIFSRGNSVAVLDFEKRSASVKYERLPQTRRVFFELTLTNAGFKLAPYSDSQSKP